MSWRHVFDVKDAGTHIERASKMCRDAGYCFMAFNEEVYFVDHEGKYHYTYIKVSEVK